MKLLDFYSLSEKSGIKHIKTMSYLENLRVTIGALQKGPLYKTAPLLRLANTCFVNPVEIF